MDPDKVSSTSDERTVNNDPDAMRHNYRVLTDGEKFFVTRTKDLGQMFLDHLVEIEQYGGRTSSALDQARTRLQEAVMWAVKHITK